MNNVPNEYPISGWALAHMGFDYDYVVYSKGRIWLSEGKEERGLPYWAVWLQGLSGGPKAHIQTMGELRKCLKKIKTS